MSTPPKVPAPIDVPEVPTPKLRRTRDLNMPPPPAWIGKGWLPRREITVLVGEEGIGKSLLWVHIAAKITTGAQFKPFGIPTRAPADVVVIITEDSSAEVVARLQLAGADMNRIIWFSTDADGTGSPVFADGIYGDFARLQEQLEDLDEKPALIVVDAWLDTVSSGMNVKDTQQARAALHPWKTFANRHDLAIVLVTHTNRLDTANTRDLMGSTAALRQKARMVLFAARPRLEDGDDPVLFVGPDKSNTTGLVDAVRFRVEVEQVREQTDDDTGTVARLSRASYATATIRNLISEWKQAEIEANRKPSKAQEAGDALAEFMADRDEAPSKEVKAHLRGLGFGQRAAEEAMQDLGEAKPTGLRGQWIYRLHSSAETSQSPQSSQTSQTWIPTANTGESETSQSDPMSVNTADSAKSADSTPDKSRHPEPTTSDTADTAKTAETSSRPFQADDYADSVSPIRPEPAAVVEATPCEDCGNPLQSAYIDIGRTTHPGCIADHNPTNNAGLSVVTSPPLSKRDQIIAFIRKNGPSRAADIAAAHPGFTPKNVTTVLGQLADEGRLRRPARGLYDLTERKEPA